MTPNPLSADLDHILDHTRGLWDELRGGRIFITGGTGFFGCWLMESFLWANDRLNLGARATVLTRSPSAFHAKAPHLAGHAAVSLLAGDVRTFDFPDGTFEHIIHAASETSPTNTPIPSNLLFHAIVQGATRVLELSARCGAKKLLFTSSGAVYGRQPPEITHAPEDYLGAPSPMEPSSAYGEGKRAAEFLFAAAAQTSGVEAKVARCFAFVGPHLPLDLNFAVGNFIRDALRGGPIHIAGDGTPRRSYLYAADLAIWLWTILLRGKNQSAYNVGSDKDLSIAQLAETVREIVNPACPITIAGTAAPSRPTARYVPSIQKARQELELDDWIELKEGIRRMTKWNLEQRQ